MNRGKSLMFFAAAIVMVALFAATEAIAQPPAASAQVTCGNGSYTATFLGYDDATTSMTYSLTGSEKNLSYIAKGMFAQDTADNIANAMIGCVFGGGGTGNSKWLENVFGLCTYNATNISGETGIRYISVPVSNSIVGAIDVAFDGGRIGLQTCTSQILGPGDTAVFPTTNCFTETITYTPVTFEDGTSYIPTCQVKVCAPPLQATVLSGDCTADAVLPLQQIIAGLTNVQGNAFGFGRIKKHQSPDEPCDTYQQDGQCYTPCCPGPPILPDGACLPTYQTCP